MGIPEELEKELNDLLSLEKILNIGNDKSNYFISTLNSLDFTKYEEALENFSVLLRYNWKKKCFIHSEKIFKSPLSEKEFNTLFGSKVTFLYERIINYIDWEKKHFDEFENFTGFNMFFSSGMSTIINIFHLIRLMYKGKLNGLFLGDYYESVMFFKNMNIRDMSMSHSKYNELDTVDYDFIFLEPIRYNTSLDMLDLDLIINYVNNNDNVKFLIIDYTLISNTLEKNKILNKLKRNIILFFIKSNLKLDQSGLEFSNIGQLTIYANKEKEKYVERLQKLLMAQRDAFGSALSFYEVCQLDYPKFNNDMYYINSLLKNVRNLSKNIVDCTNNIEVIHPSLLGNSNSPFLFIRPINAEQFERFKDHLYSYLEKHQINIPYRGSFGHRYISMEIVKMNGITNVIKIAPGKLSGIKQKVLLEGIIKSSKYIGGLTKHVN